MPNLHAIIPFLRRQPRWRLLVAAAALVLLASWLLRSHKSAASGSTFTARRGDLAINIIEGGSIEATESQEIRSEIKGMQGTKILKIVDEGYLVTEDDVKDGKVLVELDSSDLKQRIITEEIQFQSTLAALTEAQQAFDIQLNQNKTDVKAAEQKARFALMDFQKFIGTNLANDIVKRLDMHEQLDPNTFDPGRFEQLLIQSLETNSALAAEPAGEPNGKNPPRVSPGTAAAGNAAGPARRESSGPRPVGLTANGNTNNAVGPDPVRTTTNATPAASSPFSSETLASPANLSNALSSITNQSYLLDFSRYAKPELLGDGSAQQQLRALLDATQMAQAQETMQLSRLLGTERLYTNKFVPKTDLETDQMTYTNNLLKVVTAQTAYDLFIRYEFPRTAQEFLSKYDESLRALERARKEAVSKLAQFLAKMRAAEGRFKIECEQRRELREQWDKCVIRAQRPGLVIYGGGESDHWMREEQIREGATVRDRQRIITIPDMTKMAVKVKIHESHIKKVLKGLPARITLDAFPDEQLNGEVAKVGVLPDSANRWMNPDLKVYITTIDITEVREWLKPGMSAKVEVMVRQLTNVIYIPLQAVTMNQGKQICYVAHGGAPDVRPIEVGDFNDEFIEVKKGLKEGEKVLLNAPIGDREEADSADQEQADSPKKQRAPGTPAKAAERTPPKREGGRAAPVSSERPARSRAPGSAGKAGGPV